MSPRTLRALGGACLALFLVSCGDDEGSDGLPPGTTFHPLAVDDFVGTAQVLALTSTFALDFEFNTLSFSAGPASIRSRAAADLVRLAALEEGGAVDTHLVALLASPECTPTATGGGTDSDADGIPDDLTVEYTAANCTVTDTATGSFQVIRGRARYRDIPGALHGFEIVFEGIRRDELNGTDGSWIRRTTTARERAETSTTGGVWTLDLDVTSSNGFGDVIQSAGRWVQKVTGTYTATGTVPAGGPIPDGVLRLSGTIDATSLQYGRLIVHVVTTADLDYESSCSGPEGGELEMRLNGDPAEGLLVKFVGCSDVYWEFLGSGVL